MAGVYNDITGRADTATLVPLQLSQAMLTSLSGTSAALRLATKVPVSSSMVRFPVLSALPAAYFVAGDTGLKQTTKAEWDKKELNIEELAVIVPIPEAVLADSQFDFFGAIRPLLESAIARKLDEAIFFGVDKPASWPDDLATLVAASGNTEVAGTAAQAAGGIAEDFNVLLGKVEAHGYDVNGIVADPALKVALRGARDTTGQRLLDVSGEGQSVMGITLITDAMRGLWAAQNEEAFVGDFSKVVIGVRQDITYKVLDQAVLTDDTGAVVINLPQQDSIALRVTFRVGYQVANPITYENTARTAFPFGALLRS